MIKRDKLSFKTAQELSSTVTVTTLYNITEVAVNSRRKVAVVLLVLLVVVLLTCENRVTFTDDLSSFQRTSEF